MQIGRALGQALGHAERVSSLQQHVQSPSLDVGGVIQGGFDKFAGAIAEW